MSNDNNPNSIANQIILAVLLLAGVAFVGWLVWAVFSDLQSVQPREKIEVVG